MKKLFILCAILSASLFATESLKAQVTMRITIAPPSIPVYVQPECPIDGYLWTPGYWAYSPDGYYWVPGVWVAPVQTGFLWTPGYWDYDGGYYGWHNGYWGEHVGYYGGICYGYGYEGTGFYGGEWNGGRFRYNTAVSHVNTAVIHDTYVNNNIVRHDARVSYHGPGGSTAQPTPQERSAMNEHHAEASPVQRSHEQAARADKNQFASVNHGKPATAAMTAPNGQRVNPEGHAVTHTAPQASHAATPARNPNEGHPQAPNHTAPAPAQHSAGSPAQQPRPQAQHNPNPQPAPRPAENHAAQRPAPMPQSHNNAPPQQRPQASQPMPQQRNPNEGRPMPQSRPQSQPMQQPNRQPAPQMQHNAPQQAPQHAPESGGRPGGEHPGGH